MPTKVAYVTNVHTGVCLELKNVESITYVESIVIIVVINKDNTRTRHMYNSSAVAIESNITEIIVYSSKSGCLTI